MVHPSHGWSTPGLPLQLSQAADPAARGACGQGRLVDRPPYVSRKVSRTWRHRPRTETGRFLSAQLLLGYRPWPGRSCYIARMDQESIPSLDQVAALFQRTLVSQERPWAHSQVVIRITRTSQDTFAAERASAGKAWFFYSFHWGLPGSAHKGPAGCRRLWVQSCN
uniref:BRICHOS domain-containing protein n=1 Tax=Varanus komodoensis TaxID=61221 RepID=A0A8D2LH32_VARKO